VKMGSQRRRDAKNIKEKVCEKHWRIDLFSEMVLV
jgi:hypothetical protein